MSWEARVEDEDWKPLTKDFMWAEDVAEHAAKAAFDASDQADWCEQGHIDVDVRTTIDRECIHAFRVSIDWSPDFTALARPE